MEYSHQQIIDMLTELLHQQLDVPSSRLKEKSHLDRDLRMNSKQVADFFAQVERKFNLQLTSNTMIMCRTLKELAFYLEIQLAKK